MTETRSEEISEHTINWLALMRITIIHFHMAPHEFWQMTPVELLALLKDYSVSLPLARKELEAMREKFPD